jgi:hypothetical protein
MRNFALFKDDGDSVIAKLPVSIASAESAKPSASLRARLTRNRGQSPRDSVEECLLFSVAGGRFDRKIERFEGLYPVAKAPFAPLATSSTGGGAALTSG